MINQKFWIWDTVDYIWFWIKSIRILKYLTFITDFFEILPLIFCILFYKKLNTKGLKVFFIYTIILSVFVLLHIISINVIKSKELYYNVLRLYTFIEYSLLSLFFYYTLKNIFVGKLVLFSTIPFSFFCLYQYLHSINNFSVYPVLSEFIIFMVVIIYYFYEKMKTEVLRPLYQSIIFWLCVGLFIYFSGNFFYLVLIQSTNDPILINQLRVIYSIVTITKNVLLSFSFFANEIKERVINDFNIPDEINLDSFHPKSTFS